MERVQFQQEQMLAELKDLVQKSLFTVAETRQIMKKRTAFETALIRRVAKKADFLRYAAYEMALEQLRRKRVERSKKGPTPPTISDYALVRRQFHIFERALKKFKSDVGLWIQYIHVAKREGARALVGRITARAMQMHPNTPAIYILAASHELQNLSPSSARSLLQRGLRLNADSVDMWREYVSMELGFVESLRRRWEVLGINGTAVVDAQDEAAAALVEDEARKEIMGGAIVKSVISSAAKAVPKLPLFESLQSLITTYPSPLVLRTSLLAHLHSILLSTLPEEPGAIKLYATRHLTSDSTDGAGLIDALKLANEELLAAVKTSTGKGREGVCRVYAEFVEEWCSAPTADENLRLYLTASLASLTRPSTETSPSLLSTHLRLSPPSSVLKLGRKYTARVPTSAQVWLARLDAESSVVDSTVLVESWAAARRSVNVNEASLEKVWMWGLDEGRGLTLSNELLQTLLKESMLDSQLRSIHEQILIHHAHTLLSSSSSSETLLASIRHMALSYLPTAAVWASFFSLASTTTTSQAVLSEIYENWRRKGGEVDAVLAWATWLLRVAGRGDEAVRAVVAARSGIVREEGKGELDSRWGRVVDGASEGEEEDEEVVTI